MSAVELHASTSSRPGHGRIGSGQSRLNDHIGWLLIALLALSPLPFGSNRPFFWGVNACLVGIAGAWYILRLSQVGERFRYPASRLWIFIVLFGVMLLWLVIQALPIAAILNEWMPSLGLAAPGSSAPLGSSISVAPGATLLMLMQMATYGLLFFLVLQISVNAQRRMLIFNAIVVVITVYAAYGLAALYQFNDTILGIPKWAYPGMATGPFVNRNTFATFLAFGSVISLAMATGMFIAGTSRPKDSPSRRRRPIDPIPLLYFISFIITTAALFATQSRMGTLACAVGCLVVLGLNLTRASRVLQFLVALPLLAGTTAAVVYVYGQGLVERLGSSEESFDVRLDLYRQVMEMIAARPFVGFGGGSFELAYPLFHHQPVSPTLLWDKAHNTYLALWSELGVIAGSIPMLLILLAASRIRPIQGGPVAVAGLGVLVVAALHSLVDFSLEIQAVAATFVAVMALAVAGSFGGRQAA